MNFFIKAKMQSFVNPCPIIQCSVSIIRGNSGHYRYPDESAYPDVLGGALTKKGRKIAEHQCAGTGRRLQMNFSEGLFRVAEESASDADKFAWNE